MRMRLHQPSPMHLRRNSCPASFLGSSLFLVDSTCQLLLDSEVKAAQPETIIVSNCSMFLNPFVALLVEWISS